MRRLAVGELGDDFRESRERKWKAKRDHSSICLCGTRVWDEDPTCRNCGDENPDFKASPSSDAGQQHE